MPFIDPTSALWPWLAFVWGSLWGSFSNVFIGRWPREQSVVRPGSRCDACGTPVRWHDNIPLVSYILLGGRCRDCGAAIGLETPIVELSMALLSVALWGHAAAVSGPHLLPAMEWFFVLFGFGWGLVTASIVDLHHMMLPDVITLGGIGVGVIASALGFGPPLLESAVTALASAAAIIVLFIWGYRWLTGSAGMGFGDAKLLAMIGAFLGAEGAVFSLFAGAIQGLVVGGGAVLAQRRHRSGSGERLGKTRIPFGPFLAVGALEYLFWGQGVVHRYVGLLRTIIEWVV